VQEYSLLENGEENIERVYNFEVEDEHEYFANSVLVHNCLATIYARVALDKYGDSLAEIVTNEQTFPTAGRQPTVPQKYRGQYDKVNL